MPPDAGVQHSPSPSFGSVEWIERVSDSLDRHPLPMFLTLTLVALVVVFILWKRQAAADAKTLKAEQDARVELALTVVALSTRQGLVLEEVTDSLDRVELKLGGKKRHRGRKRHEPEQRSGGIDPGGNGGRGSGDNEG